MKPGHCTGSLHWYRRLPSRTANIRAFQRSEAFDSQETSNSPGCVSIKNVQQSQTSNDLTDLRLGWRSINMTNLIIPVDSGSAPKYRLVLYHHLGDLSYNLERFLTASKPCDDHFQTNFQSHLTLKLGNWLYLTKQLAVFDHFWPCLHVCVYVFVCPS